MNLDQVQVQQIPSLLESFTGWEANNKFVLRNKLGQQFMYAMEDSDVCMRQCCGSRRGFAIHLIDNTNTV
jgi:hypothetical protein